MHLVHFKKILNFFCSGVKRSPKITNFLVVSVLTFIILSYVPGSPCVIGNVWNVSSTDCDRLASNILNLSFPSPPPSLSPLKLSSIASDWWNVRFTPSVPNLAPSKISNTSEIHNGCSNISKSSHTNGSTPSLLPYSPDLCANVQLARQGANYFINSSALVVWGLPVWFGTDPS